MANGQKTRTRTKTQNPLKDLPLDDLITIKQLLADNGAGFASLIHDIEDAASHLEGSDVSTRNVRN
jgi:hypothetical protein